MSNVTHPLFLLLFTLTFFLADISALQGRQNWERDLRQAMNVPGTMAVEGSQLHLYVLSRQDGLVVFRAYADSLQWLYSSEGMERRGDRLQADARFAYLYGDGRQLTVVEPTSVLGAYSSTELPATPRSVQRIDERIYLALGEWGLASLSLESPDAVDSEPVRLLGEELDDLPVRDLVSDQTTRLYLLGGDRRLMVLEPDDESGQVDIVREVQLDRSTDRLFLTRQELFGTDAEGELFLIDVNGRTRTIGDIDEPVESLRLWNEQLVVRSARGRLWIGPLDEGPQLWRESTETGNHFTVTGEKLWVSEHNRIAPVIAARETDRRTGGDEHPELQQIDNLTIPHPRPVLVPLILQSGHNPNDIEFSYSSQIENATIRGQTLYWQPGSNQTGRYSFTVTASTPDGRSDNMEFTVEVQPFNTPPRFTPIQPVTINAEESFSYEITAFDPDGPDADLIRYIGVDLPERASINEQTGELRWTPTLQQIGEHRFQIIATDQFGAASSNDVTIQVVEAPSQEEVDLGIDDD